VDDVGHVTQPLTEFEEVLVKCRMERFGNPNDRFVNEVLPINLGAQRQRMVLAGNSMIPRWSVSFEEQFDLLG